MDMVSCRDVFLMLSDDIGCGECGGIGRGIGVSLVLGSMLWLAVMYFFF